MAVLVIREPSELRTIAQAKRQEGKRIGLVPTMGGLHEGHLSLLRQARPVCDVLIMSLFVNPTQFGENEDLERYPRDEQSDLKGAEECGVDLVFCPDAGSMYPVGFQTSISLPSLAASMCGAGRPGHFEGVATIVTKLFNLSLPHVAVFGQKDAQQLAILRQLVVDLDFDIELLTGPIVRAESGLALSSRNVYLSEEEHSQALSLYRGLSAAKQRFEEGALDKSTLIGAARAVIGASPLAQIEYLDLRDTNTLEDLDTVTRPALLAVAAHFGHTRLIDNIVLSP